MPQGSSPIKKDQLWQVRSLSFKYTSITQLQALTLKFNILQAKGPLELSIAEVETLTERHSHPEGPFALNYCVRGLC